MSNNFISRAFTGKRRQPSESERVPPGQYIAPDFPVLSAGPTPRTPQDQWTFSIEGLVAEPVKWSWEEFLRLPLQSFQVDIHCVTKWSKLDTHWQGVSIDTLFKDLAIDPKAMYVTAFSDGGYTTNLPLADMVGGKAFVAYTYEGKPLPAGTRRAGAPGGAAPLFLEERQMGARLALDGAGRARVLGIAGLQ